MMNVKTRLEGRIKVPYKWSVGETGSRFLIALRDRCEIWGTRCPTCNRVYVPPVQNCGECFQPLEEWVSVGSGGVVESFTVARQPDPMFDLEPPVVYGLIRLDDAAGSLLHFIGEIEPEHVRVGMRVRAVFAGPVLDEEYGGRFAGEIGRLASFARWLPAIDPREMAAAYDEVDVVLNTSFSEGLANTLLEAMAAGVPVITSDR